jgi:hypothetical protein
MLLARTYVQVMAHVEWTMWCVIFNQLQKSYIVVLGTNLYQTSISAHAIMVGA